MGETSLKEKTAKGILFGGLSNGTTQVLNAVFGIIISRRLSPEEYGVVGMLAIFSAIASSLQEGGFISALTNRKNASQQDFNSVFWFNVTCSLTIYIILWLAAPLIALYFHDSRLLWLSRYTFLGFVVASFSIVPRAILFKQMRMKEQTVISIVSLLLSGSIGVVLALSGFSYWGIATQAIVFVLAVSVISWYYSKFRPNFTFSIKPIKEMFGFSFKIILTNIFNAVNNNVFSLLLGKYYKDKEVGDYTQANKWNTMGSQFISGIVQNVAQPMFVQVTDNKTHLLNVFRKMLRFTAFISFPAMLTLSFVSEDFIVILLKQKWADSAHILQMLCIAGAFMPITTLFSNFIISQGKSNVNMICTVSMGLTVITTLITEGMLKPSIFGLEGIKLMIVSYVVIYISWLILWNIQAKKHIELTAAKFFKDTMPFLLATVVAIAVANFTTNNISNILIRLIANVITIFAVYLALMWILGAKILKESIDFLKKIIQKRKNKNKD